MSGYWSDQEGLSSAIRVKTPHWVSHEYILKRKHMLDSSFSINRQGRFQTISLTSMYGSEGYNRLNFDISSRQLSVRSCVTSRRSCATLPWTSRMRWPPPPPPPPWRRATSCPTVRSSPSATSVSAALRPCSSLPSSVSPESRYSYC